MGNVEAHLCLGGILASLTFLGLPLISIALYSAVARIHDLFVHSKVKLAERVDRLLRLFILTPDMHRIRHSFNLEEGDSNVSRILPWWDYAFGTVYRSAKGRS